MTEVTYKPWEDDSKHANYDTANLRRVELFDQEIEGLQVKVKRTSEGKFIVKTRVPVPPKPIAKKKAKAPARAKAAPKKTAAKKVPAKTSAPTAKNDSPVASPSKKKPAKKTSRKRK